MGGRLITINIAEADDPFREKTRQEMGEPYRTVLGHFRHASMHPWEDWAETFAHYLHIVDTLETARVYGLALRPKAASGAQLPDMTARRLDFDDFDDLIDAWFPLTNALNSLNRSMGQPDVYPFVLSQPAIAKLRFVHEIIEKAG